MVDDRDPIAAFYDRHPYPPPVEQVELMTGRVAAERRRFEHHLTWPDRPLSDDISVLVAGCGTSQAARWALKMPAARVVGIDVSETGLDEHRRLIRHQDIDNLDLRQLPIEQVADLDESFDLIVCTGVLHHLADPDGGLAALTSVLAERGAVWLMVYATHGRAGLSIMQEYCRLLGVGRDQADIQDLIATLRELPIGHPISHVLRSTPDFEQDDALADALLNPRERSYAVPELFDLIEGADLRFDRWNRQAPYLPTCGVVGQVPHHSRIAALSETDQFAAVELFRGTITTHSAILKHRGDPAARSADLWQSDRIAHAVPLRAPTAQVVTERLPPGAAAALLNRAHVHADLVLLVDDHHRRLFEAIDGRRPIGEVGDESDLAFLRLLWESDLIALDSSGAAARR